MGKQRDTKSSGGNTATVATVGSALEGSAKEQQHCRPMKGDGRIVGTATVRSTLATAVSVTQKLPEIKAE